MRWRNSPRRSAGRLARMTLTLVPTLAYPASSPAEQGKLADELKNLSIRHRTEHYVLAGTVEQARLEEFGQCLEYIYDEYTRGFEMLLKPAPGQGQTPKAGRTKSGKGESAPAPDPAPTGKDEEAGRFRVIVFATPEEYLRFGDEFLEGGTEFTRGKFLPGHQLLLIRDQEDSEETYEILFHEAFHQFLDRYLKAPPCWLNEGMATYFGAARPTPRGLVFDRPREFYWDLCRKLIRKQQTLPLIEVVKANHKTFYDKTPMAVSIDGETVRRTFAFYAESYTLVHMLLADPQSKERLHAYLRDLAADNGRHTRELTEKHFGPETWRRLEPVWVRYVESRPEKK